MQLVSNCVPPANMQHSAIKAEPVRIQWDLSLPIFAKEDFLGAVGDEYGWLGGIDQSGVLRCILPYTILSKVGVRMVRFRTQTISYGTGLDLHEEKSFLNNVVEYFRDTGAHVIIPPTNNALFRTYPDGASPAPYGSYAIDLDQPEEILWRNMSNTTRRHINVAQKGGVAIREGMQFLEPAYDLIRATFRRSNMGFMDRDSFRRFALSLGANGRLLMAEHRGVAQSYSLFAFSTPCAYWIYGGNIQGLHQGAMKLLHWKAIQHFRSLGVHKYDFFGARINAPKGSKQEGINQMKRQLGGMLSQGYVWKCSLHPWRAPVYSLGVRLLKGGDLVDQEQHKMKDYVARQPEIEESI